MLARGVAILGGGADFIIVLHKDVICMDVKKRKIFFSSRNLDRDHFKE